MQRPERRFWFRLALALGGCTVTELQQRMSSREFAEWMEYYQLDPFGDERADVRSAIVASTMANALLGSGEALDVDMFMPAFGERKLQEDDVESSPLDIDIEVIGPDEANRIMELLNATFGGVDLRA